MKKVFIEVDGDEIGFGTEGEFSQHELHGLFLHMANHIVQNQNLNNVIELMKSDPSLLKAISEMVTEQEANDFLDSELEEKE